MALCNGSNCVTHQLDSFAAQLRVPDELIVVDDCSRDESTSIVEEFAKCALFEVKLYRNETNLGCSATFERALTKCTGDLIFLSDQDDVWFPNKISHVLKLCSGQPDVLLWIHDGRLVDENLVWHGNTKFSQFKRGYGAPQGLKTGALTVVRSQLVNLALPFPKAAEHDTWIHSVAETLNARSVIETELQLVRRHSSNATDWIASSIHKINRLQVLGRELKSQAASSYERRIAFNSALFDRLPRIEAFARRSGSTSFDRKGLELRLTKEQSALMLRERLVRARAVERFTIALKMAITGKYDYFNGMKSFLQDIFRR